MRLSTHYLIVGNPYPAAYFEFGGTEFFSRNMEEPNYHLRSVRVHDKSLELTFTPDGNLPESLRLDKPHFVRFDPHEALDVRIKAVHTGNGNAIEFVYFYDCIKEENGLCFRRRALSRIVSQVSSYQLSVCDEYDKLRQEGFKPISTECRVINELDF